MATYPSPTLQNLTVEGAATVTDTIAASNFSGTSSGTNTGDQTITLTGDVAGSGTGSFATVLAAVGTAGTYGSATQIPVLTTDAKGRVIDVTLAAVSTGTVTSVGLALPSIFTVTGSPITTSGTLTGALASQTANTFFAAPSGVAGAPDFRSLVFADLPAANVPNLTSANTFTAINTFSNNQPASSAIESINIGHSGANDIVIAPNVGGGSYNTIAQPNDAAFIYAISGEGTPATGLVIAPYGPTGGIRLAADGVPSNAIGILTAYTALAPSTLTPGASPWTWQNTNAYGVFFCTVGALGSGANLVISKDNVTLYIISDNQAPPPIYVPPGFYIVVSYSTAPTSVTIVPV